MQVLQQILTKMKDITYGWYDYKHNKVILPDMPEFNDPKYFASNCRVLKPNEILKYKVGTCWDQSLFIYDELIKNKIPSQMFFMTPKKASKTHTFTICEYKDKIHWVEHSYTGHIGIHTYDTLTQCLTDVYERFKNEFTTKKVLRQITALYLFQVDVSMLMSTAILTCEKYFSIVTKTVYNLKLGKEDKDMNKTQKRKSIEAKILKCVKTMDPTETNYNRYKTMFSKMSDAQFDQLMKDIRDKKANLYMLFPNMKVPMSIPAFIQAADELGIKVTERLKRKDSVTGKTYTTPNEYMILKLPVRRARQFLKHKSAVAESDVHVDALTGQVIKPDKASALSYVETQLLYAKDLQNTIRELIKVRGGDVVAYAQFKQQLDEAGEAYLNALDPNTVTQSSITAATLLTSMLFDHNLVPNKNL
jgi:hypothetical protein